MRSLPVELDDETFETLETERRLIGFDSRSAYVRWIIEHRASITEEPDGSERILEAYRDRIVDLERRLATLADRDERADSDAQPTTPTDESAATAADPDDEAAANGSRASGDSDSGWTRSERYPSIEFRGSPRTTVSRDRAVDTVDFPDGTERTDSDRRRERTADSRPTDVESTSASDEAGTDASGLEPERVVRIRGDPVSEDADVLETVELDRLDELSRRAVAKTRSRLDRPVETGLEYRSSTELGDETIRPGADVVDLDSLSVPGRSDAEVEARREVAGRAIAFLKDRGRARKSDFVDALYERHPAGYETVEGWWSCLKRTLKQVDAIDGGGGRRVWRYTG
ncbi:hypothetical protein [Halosolutus gelatinilyticus]|uniref:hypothetical protein n=1 Tax=Halosolutus gelatinilyticus TaxID=2931975 RepID=UPI001FF4C6B5|nr:hypothetical protein [Halosolutus gelatinilyticus]